MPLSADIKKAKESDLAYSNLSDASIFEMIFLAKIFCTEKEDRYFLRYITYSDKGTRNYAVMYNSESTIMEKPQRKDRYSYYQK